MTQDSLPGAQLDLHFTRRGDRTFLERRLFRSPFVVTRTFQLDSRPTHLVTLLTQTSSGALQSGDDLLQRIRVNAGAAAHVRSQGATSVHRAQAGETSRERVILEVAREGHLEFLPEPKVLFPGSGLAQSTCLCCEEGSVAMVCDAFVPHDPLGQDRAFREFGSETSICVGRSRPLVFERTALTQVPAWKGRRRRFRAFGTFYAVLPLASAQLDELCGAINDELEVAGIYGAASLLPESVGIVLRLACQHGEALRAGLRIGWARSRGAVTGAEPPMRIR